MDEKQHLENVASQLIGVFYSLMYKSRSILGQFFCQKIRLTHNRYGICAPKDVLTNVFLI